MLIDLFLRSRKGESDDRGLVRSDRVRLGLVGLPVLWLADGSVGTPALLVRGCRPSCQAGMPRAARCSAVRPASAAFAASRPAAGAAPAAAGGGLGCVAAAGAPPRVTSSWKCLRVLPPCRF